MESRVAKVLAALLMATIMSSQAMAEGLVLPKEGGDPITLNLSESIAADAEPSDLLEAFVGHAPCCDGRTPIAGRYARTDDALTFLPAFGFDPGQDYVARVRTARGEELVSFRIPTTAMTVPAVVTEIYPSGDTLPENTLRFYIHFSVPMTPHVAFDYIKLRDASGNADEAAFMRFKQELWNEDRTRLTVLIDPGRIKRNVATNVELGPALLTGQRYTLSVDAGWPSADGTSVLPAYEKQFVVADPLRELPDVDRWEITSPCLGTKEPLRITFDRPFDRHLLRQAIRVISKGGRTVAGTVQVTDAERHWALVPEEEWSSENVQVQISAELEDVAANNFRDLLDHLGASEVIDISTLSVPVKLNRCSG